MTQTSRLAALKPARAPLSKRLPEMTDAKLLHYQTAVTRMIADPEHPKHAAARRSLPKIESEISRRADKLEPLAT